MKTYVALGCSQTLDYAFLLPASALLWEDVVGYHPMALLVGNEAEWSEGKLAVILRALRDIEIEHHFIGRAEGYPDAATAQNSRQHAAAFKHIESNDWVMPADADLWPLKHGYFHQHEDEKKLKAVCYYSNGDGFISKQDVLNRTSQGFGSQTLPTCHAVMRARDWRSIYGLTPGEPIAGAVKRSLDAWMPGRIATASYNDGMHLWMSDQQLMTVALCQQTWFPSMVKFIERRGHPPVDRLDRSHASDWDKLELDRWTDAHVHRAPWTDEHWPALMAIVGALLPQYAEWAYRYREEFVNAL